MNPSAIAYTLMALAGGSALSHYMLAASYVSSYLMPSIDSELPPNPMPAAPFKWEFINMTEKGACGYRKCFFRSTVNDTEGYLVAREKEKDEELSNGYYKRLVRIYMDARHLESKFNASHFLLDWPEEVSMPSPDRLLILNQLVSHKQQNFFGSAKEYSKSQQGKQLIVQKVRIAPTPNLIARCYFFKPGKQGRFLLDHTSDAKAAFQLAAAKSSAFIETFRKEIKEFIHLLGKEPRLWYDFQFMIDSSGKIHHIDLDRMEMKSFSTPTSKGAQACLGQALKEVAKILDLPIAS